MTINSRDAIIASLQDLKVWMTKLDDPKGNETMRQQLIPARAFPPGKILQKELEARKLTQADLAAIEQGFPRIVAEVIQGNQIITREIAIKLSKVFGTSAECWINLENNYRLYLAKKAVEQSINVSNL